MKNTIFIICLIIIAGCASSPSNGVFEVNKNNGLIKNSSSNDLKGHRCVALVVGNSLYEKAKLKNPSNDATDIANKLKSFGFDVEKLLNVDKRAIENAITRFGIKLNKENTAGLFYFAGHGMQVNNQNYLIPIGANINDEADISYEAVNIGRVLAKMDLAKNNLNMIILDACRDNPFSRGFRSSSRGLTRINAPKGSMILYATSPGKVAADGNKRNGLFTEKLLLAMNNKESNVYDVFKETAIAVDKSSNSQQTPWVEGVILGDFYFNNKKPNNQFYSKDTPKSSSYEIAGESSYELKDIEFKKDLRKLISHAETGFHGIKGKQTYKSDGFLMYESLFITDDCCKSSNDDPRIMVVNSKHGDYTTWEYSIVSITKDTENLINQLEHSIVILQNSIPEGWDIYLNPRRKLKNGTKILEATNHDNNIFLTLSITGYKANKSGKSWAVKLAIKSKKTG